MSIEDRLDREVSTWEPENPGDQVIGTITDIGEWEGDYGVSPTLTIADDNGDEHVVFCSNSVLRRNFERQRPAVGDRVGIRYLGEAVGKSGRSYRNYRFVLDRAAGAPAAADGTDAASGTTSTPEPPTPSVPSAPSLDDDPDAPF